MKNLNDYINNTNTEKSFFTKDSMHLIAGVDEAGRGPLAGPVSIGFAVFDRSFIFSKIPEDFHGMNDSKKVKENQRKLLCKSIQNHTVFSCCIHVNSRIVDKLNINGAIEYGIICAMKRSEKEGLQIDSVLIDGNYNFKNLKNDFSSCQFHSIIKGDQTVFSIASASILAKTSRDNRLYKFDKIFPGYGLSSHKGYGTKKHRDAIRTLGPTTMHRKSYRLL